MIKPHGSDELNPLFVYDPAANEALQKEAEGLASIVVSSATAANAVMLGAGYFNPLTGYMSKADALSVATDMKTTWLKMLAESKPVTASLLKILTLMATLL